MGSIFYGQYGSLCFDFFVEFLVNLKYRVLIGIQFSRRLVS